MSKTINNLNQSLEQQLNSNELQDIVDNNLQTEAKSIVGAINEIVGKQTISNAIGAPLIDSDTWNNMETKINGLLSTFKTNMMNNGVTVESGDKFKQLIDKIATMAGEGQGKGIQFASGVYNIKGYPSGITYPSADRIKVINHGLNCVPTFVFMKMKGSVIYVNGQYANTDIFYISNLSVSTISGGSSSKQTAQITDINDLTFTLNLQARPMSDFDAEWYAIGIGEEDTTLRDSLANILEDKGIDVTEEDDMASLIGKVDVALDNNISDYLMAASSQVSFRIGGTSWTEVSFNHSFGKVPKLVLIGIDGFGSLVSSMRHTNESNYATYTYSSSSKVYMYISSIDGSKITLNMKYSNASGSMSTAMTFYYTMIY